MFEKCSMCGEERGYVARMTPGKWHYCAACQKTYCPSCADRHLGGSGWATYGQRTCTCGNKTKVL